MNFTKSTLLLLLVVTSARCHRYYRQEHEVDQEEKVTSRLLREPEVEDQLKNTAFPEVTERGGSNTEVDEGKTVVPLSVKRLERMLGKAILKIITGDLSTANMLLLKSLNYSPEQVLAIRERELGKRKFDKDENVEKTGKEETEETEEEKEEKEEGEENKMKKIVYGDVPHRKKKSGETKMQHLGQFDYSPRLQIADGKNRMEMDYENLKQEHDWKKELSFEKRAYDSKGFDFDAYNRQAVYDYENAASKLEFNQPWEEDSAMYDYEEQPRSTKKKKKKYAKSAGEKIHESFSKAMEPEVVFKLRYDDSEFDSNSDERTKSNGKENRSTVKSPGKSFHAATTPLHAQTPLVYRFGNFNKVKKDHSKNRLQATTENGPLEESGAESSTKENILQSNTSENTMVTGNVSRNETDRPSGTSKNIMKYEGLEWVEDDVYRVIPEAMESLNYESEENETSDYYEQNSSYQGAYVYSANESANDTSDYQNDPPDPVQLFMANANVSIENVPITNLSAYQQLALAHRKDQGQRAIEDIKQRVLAMTGRFNLSSNTNQVQPERLTMFSPTCEIPRNTDPEAWADPFSMNMHFQLNLTSSEHVVAAKLRLFKLPQENITLSNNGPFEDDEEDEKKIRISVYFYTKSLKKHRSKKRLMDSVVTSLKSVGKHLAMDVRQGLRFWRLNQRNNHGNGNNHGLVIQVEDQDGRPLKPALYIQESSCHSSDHDPDKKAYQHVPGLFIKACSRYVRVVNGETVTYVDCRPSRNRH